MFPVNSDRRRSVATNDRNMVSLQEEKKDKFWQTFKLPFFETLDDTENQISISVTEIRFSSAVKDETLTCRRRPSVPASC